MKANEAPVKIYLYKAGKDIDNRWWYKNFSQYNIEYTRTDAFIEKACEVFCKVRCNGHPPRSTCTSLGTCMEYDNFRKTLEEDLV